MKYLFLFIDYIIKDINLYTIKLNNDKIGTTHFSVTRNTEFDLSIGYPAFLLYTHRDDKRFMCMYYGSKRYTNIDILIPIIESDSSVLEITPIENSTNVKIKNKLPYDCAIGIAELN
jgi:hypothetical protein